jgi:hypothetical protein
MPSDLCVALDSSNPQIFLLVIFLSDIGRTLQLTITPSWVYCHDVFPMISSRQATSLFPSPRY